MKKISFWLLIILFTGISCTKDNAIDDECLETGIQGEWHWIKTEGGLSGGSLSRFMWT